MKQNEKNKLFFLLSIFFLCEITALHAAQEKSSRTTTLPEVVVSANEETAKVFLPVEGTKIYSGKKASWIDLEKAPTNVNNNFRQALQETPGLLLSEESTPLLSVGYRGLDPHRAQFSQILKDGVPIHADMFGYPEAYYVPAIEILDHIDFLHGGASLMYGPQPGGALNFVTKDPYELPFQFETKNSGGSHGLFSTYESVSGTKDSVGYYGYFHHRQAQGFRDFNSQYELFYGGLKLKIEKDPAIRWTIAWDSYHETHGEPGGLTRQQFDLDSSVSTKLIDEFELNRHEGSIGYERTISERTLLEAKTYAIYYERLSWRQRGGGFGSAPSGANASTNDIESQEFYTAGLDTRIKHDYQGIGYSNHTLTGGFLYHHTTSPRLDKRGSEADAREGIVRKDSDREMNYLSLFIENLFRFGKLSITPGLRLENIWQSIQENVNLDKTTTPLADESVYDFVALGGVGAEYEWMDELSLYSNFSQGYRPKIFTQAVPNGTNQIVNEDLKEGSSWQVDAGLKGKLFSSLSWDLSYFYMEFQDQIGSATVNGQSSVQNVGDARHQGVELAAQMDVLKLWNKNSFSLFYNAMFLDAEFVGGPNTEKTPQYAPDFIQKTGVEYRWHEKLKVRLAGTFTDDHFANDTNTEQFSVPSYKVWDLTGDFNLYKDQISVFAGINNLFDEHYFARVRADGIDPADGRNYYAGMKFIWG